MCIKQQISTGFDFSCSSLVYCKIILSREKDITPSVVKSCENLFVKEQNYFYWNGGIGDALGFFNTGSTYVNTSTVLTNPNATQLGAYTIPYTPCAMMLYSTIL